MFNLQARIDFKEIESITRSVVNKLHRSCRTVRNPLHKSQSRIMQCFTSLFGQARRRSFFNHLLVSTLHRTVSFTEYDSISFTITKNLHFNMSTTFHVFFDKETRILKVVFTQPLNSLKTFNKFCFVVANTHTNAATACSALKHHRVANFFGMCNRIIQVFQKSGTRN